MRYVKYIFIIIYCLIRLPIKSLLNFGKLRFRLVQLISPNAIIELDGDKARMVFDRITVLAGTTLRASGGKLKINDRVFINKNCMIVAQEHIEIGKGTTIGPNVIIYDHDHVFGRGKKESEHPFRRKKVIIGKNVWIGAGVIILKGTAIGDNCVIAAGTVISGEVPDNTLVKQDRKLKYIGIE